MSGSTRAGLARRCPWGLVGMIALVGLVETGVGLRALALYDTDEWAFRWGRQAATTRSRDAKILCFGDSLVKLSVIPSVVADRTGRPTFNLALSGSQAPTSYFMLKRSLDSGAKPEAVVVDFNPPLLRANSRHILNRWGVLLDPAETAQLSWWARDPDLFAAVTLGQVLPSFRGKTSIRASIMDALAGRLNVNPAWNGMALRNWEKNDGAQLMVGSAAVMNMTHEAIVKLREGYYPVWKCDRANEQGIAHFLDLASKHGIRVFWVLAPLVPAFHEEIARSGIDAEHEAFVRSWQAKYPDLVIVDARRKVTELGGFWDPQHLSVVGASAFSRTLGDTLRRSLGGKLDDRWVALPEIKVGQPAPGVENMEESRVAVERALKLIR